MLSVDVRPEFPQKIRAGSFEIHRRFIVIRLYEAEILLWLDYQTGIVLAKLLGWRTKKHRFKSTMHSYAKSKVEAAMQIRDSSYQRFDLGGDSEARL